MKNTETEINKEESSANKATDKGLTSKIYCMAHAAQYQKKKKPQKTQSKKGRRFKQTFIQIRHTDGQNAHEKNAECY